MDERLEFIEGVFSKSIENHESPLDNLEIEDVDYLIDEAKKVPELEESRKEIAASFKATWEENQRYKEALEKAIGGCIYTNPEVAGILSEALRGES